MTIWRMRFASWINKATDTHSEYVIVISFPRLQWSRERARMLRYTYTTSLVIGTNNMEDARCVLSKLFGSAKRVQSAGSGLRAECRELCYLRYCYLLVEMKLSVLFVT